MGYGVLNSNDEETPMRVSRPCYDKPHRCPGWAGGGFRYARVQRCKGGYIRRYEAITGRRLYDWRCRDCGVFVLPYAVRWLDPSYLQWKIPFTLRRLWD